MEQCRIDLLKERVPSAENVRYFLKNRRVMIIGENSPEGLGAVLLQEQQGTRKVISYARKYLSEVERRYSD